MIGCCNLRCQGNLWVGVVWCLAYYVSRCAESCAEIAHCPAARARALPFTLDQNRQIQSAELSRAQNTLVTKHFFFASYQCWNQISLLGGRSQVSPKVTWPLCPSWRVVNWQPIWLGQEIAAAYQNWTVTHRAPRIFPLLLFVLESLISVWTKFLAILNEIRPFSMWTPNQKLFKRLVSFLDSTEYFRKLFKIWRKSKIPFLYKTSQISFKKMHLNMIRFIKNTDNSFHILITFGRKMLRSFWRMIK